MSLINKCNKVANSKHSSFISRTDAQNKMKPAMLAVMVSALLMGQNVYAQEFNSKLEISGKKTIKPNDPTSYDSINFSPKSELIIEDTVVVTKNITSKNEDLDHSTIVLKNSGIFVKEANFDHLNIEVESFKDSKNAGSKIGIHHLELKNGAGIKDKRPLDGGQGGLDFLKIDTLILSGLTGLNGTTPEQGILIYNDRDVKVLLGAVKGEGYLNFTNTSLRYENAASLKIDSISANIFRLLVVNYNLVNIGDVSINDGAGFAFELISQANIGNVKLIGNTKGDVFHIFHSKNMKFKSLLLDGMNKNTDTDKVPSILNSNIDIESDFILNNGSKISVWNTKEFKIAGNLSLNDSYFNSLQSSLQLNNLYLQNNSLFISDTDLSVTDIKIDDASSLSLQAQIKDKTTGQENVESKDLTIKGKGEFTLNNQSPNQQTISLGKLHLTGGGSLDLKAVGASQNLAHLSGVNSIIIDEGASLNLHSNDFTADDVKEISSSKPALSDDQKIISVFAKDGITNAGMITGSGMLNQLNAASNSSVYVGNASSNKTNTAAGFGHLYIGSYQGEADSSLHFGIAINGNNSLADRLTIAEASHGESKVYVHTVGAIGEGKTDHGIYLVDTSLIQDAANDQLALTLGKEVSYGLYDYHLIKREQDDSQGISAGWYLKEAYGQKETFGPEGNAYLANDVVVNKMFALSYKDRDYVNERGLWVNVGSSLGKFKSDLTNAVRSKMDYYTMRIGHDLFVNHDFVAGIMGAYGYASGSTQNKNTHKKLDNKLHGFSVGLYGTYQLSDTSYVDGWVQYVYAQNRIEGQLQSDEKYHAKGLMASLEIGKSYSLTDSLWITPQAQVTWMGIKSEDHQAANGIRYSGQRGNWQMRIGARLAAKNSVFNAGAPYLEINYIHNTRENSIKMDHGQSLGSHTISSDGAKNLYQIKIGTDFSLNNKTRLGGEISHVFGKNSYKDTRLNLNLRYDF